MREQITGDTWRACLAREYQVQARYQLRSGRHWTQAALLAEKGRQSLDGLDPAPEPAAETLSSRWSDLNAAIAMHGRSCACASAQAKLDAWSVALDQNPSRDQAPLVTGFDTAMRACNEGTSP